MRRAAVRWLPRVLLGSFVCVSVLGAHAGNAQAALDPDAIEGLLHNVEGLHPPKIELPHVVVPPVVATTEFGTDNLRVTGVLDRDKTNFDAAVTDAAEEATDQDTAEEDAVKKCVAAGLLAMIAEVLEASQPVSIEETLQSAMKPCFDDLAPEGAKRTLELAEYFSKATTGQIDRAYEDSGENAIVLGNWIRRTAATIAPPTEPSSTTETTPEPPPEPTKSGFSTGGIIAIVIIVAGIALGIVGYKGRRR